jgi:hypothetical protein
MKVPRPDPVDSVADINRHGVRVEIEVLDEDRHGREQGAILEEVQGPMRAATGSYAAPPRP